jgi:hypothetical protein
MSTHEASFARAVWLGTSPLAQALCQAPTVQRAPRRPGGARAPLARPGQSARAKATRARPKRAVFAAQSSRVSPSRVMIGQSVPQALTLSRTEGRKAPPTPRSPEGRAGVGEGPGPRRQRAERAQASKRRSGACPRRTVPARRIVIGAKRRACVWGVRGCCLQC